MSAFDPTNQKYKLDHISGGSAAARLASLTRGGPLKVSDEHYLAVTMPHLTRDGPSPGIKIIDYKFVEYVLSVAHS